MERTKSHDHLGKKSLDKKETRTIIEPLKAIAVCFFKSWIGTLLDGENKNITKQMTLI